MRQQWASSSTPSSSTACLLPACLPACGPFRHCHTSLACSCNLIKATTDGRTEGDHFCHSSISHGATNEGIWRAIERIGPPRTLSHSAPSAAALSAKALFEIPIWDRIECGRKQCRRRLPDCRVAAGRRFNQEDTRSIKWDGGGGDASNRWREGGETTKSFQRLRRATFSLWPGSKGCRSACRQIETWQ